jgi:hypothetical protein
VSLVSLTFAAFDDIEKLQETNENAKPASVANVNK